VLEKLFENHTRLGAKTTIPFASLMRFSMTDNRYMNAFANRPRDVWELAQRRGLGVTILFPGDTYDSSARYDPAPALAKYDALYETIDQFAYDTPVAVPLKPIAEAFHEIARHLHDKYPAPILHMLRPVVVKLPDLDTTVRFSIPDDSFSQVEPTRPPDIIMRCTCVSSDLTECRRCQARRSTRWYATWRTGGSTGRFSRLTMRTRTVV
jgi:hypothetical protein